MKKLCLILGSLVLITSCANIVAPTGGDKDIFPPILLSIDEKKESGNIKTLYFEFDEFIVLNNWEENFYISPPIKKRVLKNVNGKTLQLIIDDTLVENTTYNLSLSSCIKDLNEGNILDTLNYAFSNTNQIDTLSISGQLQDAYILKKIENAWIMLYETSRINTSVFQEAPNYVAKTDQHGIFNFPNLKAKKYQIVALTGFDLVYNEDEQIAFLDNSVDAKLESNFIALFAFNPITDIDSAIIKTSNIPEDSISISDTTIVKEKVLYGNLEINCPLNSPAIFQLLQNEKIISEFIFTKSPYKLTRLTPGKYQLKYILDANQDGKWNTGNWEDRIQPEKVINYPNEITIRSNWDLELDWNLD